MVNVIPTNVKNLWDAWNIRGIILFSLSLQALLILISPFRKATAKSFVTVLVWSGYLVADWAASYTIGLISNSQADPNTIGLLAFWAPFLLLHLGGPDTITALALEDNELWLRHMLSLVSQAVVSLYVFAQSLPDSKLWLPTTLLFVAGIIKYAERTRALFLASQDRFRESMATQPDPGVDYDMLMEDYGSSLEAGLPTQIIYAPEPVLVERPRDRTFKLTDVQVVQQAYHYFDAFKGLVVDIIFSFRKFNQSRYFFRRLESDTALRVMEVELNFIYEVMFTKVQVMQSKAGYFFRGLAFGATLASLGVFYYKVPKSGLSRFDVKVTYTLLLGAIALDFIALFMLIFSDWTLAKLNVGDNVDEEDESSSSKPAEKPNDTWGKKLKRWFTPIFGVFLRCKKPHWRPSECLSDIDDCYGENFHNHGQHWVLATPFLLRRWSGSLSGHNLIRFCLKGRHQRIHEFTGWTRVLVQKIQKLLGIALLRKFMGKSITATPKFPDFLSPVHGFVEKVGIKVRHLMTERRWTCWVLVLADTIPKRVRSVFSIPRNLLYSLGPHDTIDSFLYVSTDRLTKELWTFIFHELQLRSDNVISPETAKRISSARGDWILTYYDTKLPENIADEFLQYVTGVTYDESLLLWHIATELCYNYDRPKGKAQATKKKGKDECKPLTDRETLITLRRCDYREFSKMLSDYMMYLLVMQPTMMSPVAGIGKVRYRDTCAEAERFFKRRYLKPDQQKEACEQILQVNTTIDPLDVKGDSCKSVLFYACILAKKLNDLDKLNELEPDPEKKYMTKWKLLSKIWVEMMSYAAARCRANSHTRQLSKGGELITFVWLLMAHLGLREDFMPNERQRKAKFVAGR